MKHTLVAVFDNRSDAQKAMDDLLASGFSRSDLRLSEGGTQTETAASGADLHEDESFSDSIKHFFADLFGSDRSRRLGQYSEAIARGHYVLTVTAPNEPEVERAADLVERYGPLDIDETSSAWPSASAAGSTAGMSAGIQQQSASMSQQSGQGPAQASTGSSMQFASTESQSIPVVQEQPKVGKREVQRGGVRIFTYGVETPVDESVNLREEQVTVQRRATDKMVDPAEVPAFQENVKDTLRRTEVEVEQLSDTKDDDYYRSHWTGNLAGTGKTYDEYAPAYRYGSEMRRSELYRGRPFEEVETDLRSDWARTHPGSAWESFKAAVRHGWDRMTS
ncbi:DUF2382 domain-containing protein [Massilia sp. RP-1-19]|uniref:DUF2382 domain-containing protein n=1 Tax=Massilia polaris TaxID=2728846 RepID=A0A848HED2_9BURK|nr:DUF2382 domain-containing protein [Massilia polaris]NML60166.1 DUF2382 domain-containing protein [Massilia polaris]